MYYNSYVLDEKAILLLFFFFFLIGNYHLEYALENH